MRVGMVLYTGHKETHLVRARPQNSWNSSHAPSAPLLFQKMVCVQANESENEPVKN